MPGTGLKDIMWLDTDGSEMAAENWNSGTARCLGMLLSGDALDVRDFRGNPVRDDTYLLLLNAHHEPVKFILPGKSGVNWEVVINTDLESGFATEHIAHAAGDELEVTARATNVLRLVKGSQEDARSISWKHQQKSEAVAPPMPRRPSKHEPVDPTTAGTRAKARSNKGPGISDLTQGAQEPGGPAIR